MVLDFWGWTHVGIVVSGSHYLGFGVVQQRQELVEEAVLAFGREEEVQAPHAAAEDGEVVVHVVAWRHPAQRLVHFHLLTPLVKTTYHKATHS